MLWAYFAPKWVQAEWCKSHEWKELIPVIVVHTIISNKTQWLFHNLAFFRAKNRLQSSANGESSLDVMSLFPLANWTFLRLWHAGGTVTLASQLHLTPPPPPPISFCLPCMRIHSAVSLRAHAQWCSVVCLLFRSYRTGDITCSLAGRVLRDDTNN